ncbi:acetate--CoA ligase family protein, partial [Desulfovibrio sp. OttesenSCG-928-G15]|nr:acetate--CoA ligase family protein [Desulfovibrio sp. OttesenSCG-928-G15]
HNEDCLMKLFEFQAKQAFAESGIPVPKSVLATTVDEVTKAAGETGYPCVLKSQVLRGGRGKAGLIQVVRNEQEAKDKAAALFASEHNVFRILVEEAVSIAREIYMAITLDPVSAQALIIASAEGGVEIETLAVEAPDKLVQVRVDLDWGLMPHHVREVAFGLGLEGETAKAVSEILKNLYKVFRKFGAELAEINPLFITTDGAVIAGDGKLITDDNLGSADYPITRDYYDTDTEYEAALEGIPYLQFDGDISLMCAGAGLTTTVFDLINYAGGTVANYLEFGGPNYKKAREAMQLCLKNKCKVILVVTFGTIARADVMAQGLVDAMNELKPDVPIVTCIRGTNEEEAFAILQGVGLKPLSETEDAVQRAVDIAAGRL